MTESRLDAALAARGLARSRTHAAALIAQGRVTIDGRHVIKPSARVTELQQLVVSAADDYVGRGAHKLVAALDAFAISVKGRFALDAGASTGGFSQVLLERGAARVIAVDVGHGQLATLVAEHPRVVSVEGFNVRYMTRDSLAAAVDIGGQSDLVGAGPVVADLVVADLSFISLTTVLPALVATAEEGADFVLLVKPQFEVGRAGIREGIVHRADLRADAIGGVLWAGWDCGLRTAGIVPSPLLGSHGNHEYLLWLSATTGKHPTEWLRQISMMVGA